MDESVFVNHLLRPRVGRQLHPAALLGTDEVVATQLPECPLDHAHADAELLAERAVTGRAVSGIQFPGCDPPFEFPGQLAVERLPYSRDDFTDRHIRV